MTYRWPEPPERLNHEQAEVWRDIIALAPHGMLLPVDHWIVEVTARAVVRCRAENAIRGEFNEAASCLARCGLTPRSRARILKHLAPVQTNKVQ